MDLEQYIGNYTHHTKILRLIFIADNSPQFAGEAVRMALEELKKTTNTSLYSQVCSKHAEKLSMPRDDAWIASVDKRAQLDLEKLEAELCGFNTNMVKESIRMGHNDLGDFHYNRGDFNSALKSYVRTRDYCTTSKHIIQMCLNVIKVSIQMGNFTHVSNYVAKAEQTPDVQDTVVLAKLKCCSGLAHLEAKKYKLAARKFLETTIDLGTSFNEVLSPQDVAVYGSLCALAAFERSELKSKVIDNTMFKNFLELMPQVRELVYDFYGSKYANCLQCIEKMKPDLKLDTHLHDHVDALYEQIRNRALTQYFSPFISVDMNVMATAFNTPVADLEKELAKLIMDNHIQARIDSHNKILYARHANQRAVTFQKALVMGETYVRDTKASILRINLMRNDFVVKGGKDPEKHK